MKSASSQGSYIVHVSSYPPRECGIATFTQDLTNAFDKKFNPLVKSKIVALNEESTRIYNYGSRVFDAIVANELERYVLLAKKLNARPDVKVVNIQHEFGLYGGIWGDYLVPFVQVLEKPFVVTLHTVLPDPDDDMRHVVKIISQRAKALIVMNKRSQSLLVSTYRVPKSKIVLIPHGIPQTPFEPSDAYKKELGLEDRLVMSTFGLLSPNKGIEYAIRALPNVIAAHPEVIYLVLGATHPNIRRDHGEVYRNFLNDEVKRLGLENHVKFYDKYLSLEELITFLKATDIYIAPAVDAKQSVSGTISYALGCGRPVISTRTEYAKYIITPRVGLIVPRKSAVSMSKAMLKLVGDKKLRDAMCTEAYEATRPMAWPNVADAYFRLYAKFADVHGEEEKLPEIKFDHVIRLTDARGILHFATYSTPEKKFGYSMDDNARALIVCAMEYCRNPQPKLVELMQTYIDFSRFVQRNDGTFANIVSERHKRDATRDEDVQGRALWALGFAASRDCIPEKIKAQAETMFMKGLNVLPTITTPRATAFAILGLYYFLKYKPKKQLLRVFTRLADRLIEQFASVATEDWQWFEDVLTYTNSKLPESLFCAYELTKNKKYLDIAETTLAFLCDISLRDGFYVPIGQNGWYFRHKKRAYFDQQPEDTASMVEAKIAAYKTTGKKQHLEDAHTVFQWFLGRNHLHQTVYDEATGGCYDGVGQYAINLNQGAESTISYLLARLAFETIDKPKKYHEHTR